MEQSKTISIWVLGDQLMDTHPALAYANENFPEAIVKIVMVEAWGRAKWLPYHKQKIVLLFSAMRHYAELLQERGIYVDYVTCDTISDGLKQHIEQHRPNTFVTMAASNYRGRRFQRRLSDHFDCDVILIENQQFLTSQHNPYPQPEPNKRYVMEYFYRDMRHAFNILMENGEPVGGQWNFDKDNRKPLPKNHVLPDDTTFERDHITDQVIREVEAAGIGIGNVRKFNYAVTHEQATQALRGFVEHRLAEFGPYEDAMTVRQGQLFHSVLSPYLNIGLLTPMQTIKVVIEAYDNGKAPVQSVEGFVRQVLGWREYMYWQYWRLMPALADQNAWQAERDVPQMFWDGDTSMNCINHITERLLETAYTHHIERLMVISNFFLLADVNPRDATTWFKSMFIDAYDWVMQPNVIGMGMNADDGQIATKPYIASANYINKMSDYCKSCHFDHRKRTGEDACPFNFLYWNFLITHEDRLRANPRAGRNVLGLRHLDEDEKRRVTEQAKSFLDSLE